MLAVSVTAVLLLVRSLEPGSRFATGTWWSPAAYLWHDAAVVLLFGAFEWFCGRRRVFVLVAYVVVTVYAVANIPVERALWSPLTIPMLRAAGGPLTDSIAYYATWTNAALVAMGLVSVLAAPFLCGAIPARPVLGVVAACVIVGPIAGPRVDTEGRERNAWTALASTVTLRATVPVAARDWRASDRAIPDDQDLRRFRGAAAGRNVVLVSLESTAAGYLGLYGASQDVAPNLSRLARSGIVFDNAYAVYPESIKGLFSILCSRPPAVASPTDVDASAPCHSLAAQLGSPGYRTALFHSGRFGYLGMEAVIRGRGYDVLADAGDIGGVHDSSFGIDEPSTVASILRWIDSGPKQRPFFVTYLPIAGHHPYETPDRGPFPDHDEFGRYRNALHYGDAALGSLMQGLEARGLDRDTLWIVLGDHGEAFGQHQGNYGHTFQLFDENVRVPFVIAAPGLVSQPIRARRVVSLVDTAPTILDLLGRPLPAEYDGGSMLDGRARNALFFTDYSLMLAGVRDGPNKIISDLRTGRSRWFDVERDPAETTDLSTRRPEETRRYSQMLADWVAATRADRRR
jgi:hypothetical protein